MSTIAERVEAGAKWLDANRPGWVDRINLETLDMASNTRCVLGQEFGDYLLRPGDLWGMRGFALGFGETWQPPGPLADAWRDYITARRAAA